MAIQLRWLENRSASCFHAVAAILRGHGLSDLLLGDALAEGSEALRVELKCAGVDVNLFLAHLVSLSVQIGSNTELARIALKKTSGNRATRKQIEPLRGALFDLEAAFDRALPQLEEELALRRGPLEAQWDARGPGMLSVIRRLTDESFIAEEAEVILVHPASGGAGEAHILYNSVRIEALLANPLAELPEVVRLGWLLAQLNLELPRYSEVLGNRQIAALGPCAMIPIALAAAGEVELARLDKATIRMALEAWHAVPSGVPNMEGVLWQWWQVYRDTRPPLATALKALGEMVTAAAHEAQGS